jgi:hypothetical protein
MFPLLFSMFALIICLVSLVLSVIGKNTGWIIVMAICMVVNITAVIINLINV